MLEFILAVAIIGVAVTAYFLVKKHKDHATSTTSPDPRAPHVDPKDVTPTR